MKSHKSSFIPEGGESYNPDVNPSSVNTQKLNLGLFYNTVPSGLSGNIQYHDNISAMVWNTTGKTKQGYGFSYDGFNRLTLGDHKAYSSS